MKLQSIFKLTPALIIGLLFVLPCSGQTTSHKKRTVYTAPPTGSLLGGGYADSGDADAPKAARATTVSAADKPSFREALAHFDAQTGTIVGGYALIVPAVKLQTGVATETLTRQHEVTGLTYGELLVANSLASGSGKSFNDIIAIKNKGKSWSQISKELGVNIDSITARLKTAEESVRFAQTRKRERRSRNVGETMRNLERNAHPAPGG